MDADTVRAEFDVTALKVPLSNVELLLKEDDCSRVAEEDIIARLPDIFMDYKFDTGIKGNKNLPASSKRIRRVASLENRGIRAACFSHPPRAELEMQAYGRDHFVRSSASLLSVPMVCFVDGFGLYRNMYRTVMGVYLTLASMNIRHRTRQANMFPLTLGPHASNFGDVISGISGFTELDKGLELDINGEKDGLCIRCTFYRRHASAARQ
jgi:hypothetical protein